MLILLSIIDLHTGLKNKDNIPYVMIVMSSVCLLNVKLGGWLYFILTFVIYLLFLFLQKEKQKLSKLITSFIVILVLFVISGINPCLTNLIVKKRNMFYPLQGSHKIDIITGNSPRKFVKSFYLKSFVISTFSKVDNFNYQSSKNPELKLPFSIYKTELKQLHYVGARVCGFGVFWSGIVILSIILMFFVRYKNKENTKLFKLLLFIMLALLLANPYSWWARYVPHIWAIPLIVSMHLLKQKNKNVVKNILLHALLFIMLANITLQMHQILKMQIVEKNAMAEAIQKLKNKNMHLQIYTIYDYSLIQRLNENKISFELIDSEYFEKHKKDFVFIPIALEDIMYWNNKD